MNPINRPNQASPIGFTFLTNHSHVLALIARQSDARMNEIAARAGITERAVQRIVNELSEAGYLTVVREGRRNHYVIASEMPLRHPVEGHLTIGDLIEVIKRGSGKQSQIEEETFKDTNHTSR